MATGKSTDTALAQQLVAGTRKHFSNVGSLTFGGETATPAQAEALFQTLVDLRSAVDAAKASMQARLAAEEAQAPLLRSRMAAFVAFVRATFGNSPDILADFGLRPRKAKTPLTIEEQAVAVARRKATRAARHTMGKNQKKEVKGTVTTIVTSTPPRA